jgi:23S rRNA (cytosine1962-C5)-methyltransferase
MHPKNQTYPKIRLKKGEEKRLLKGELWVYRDQIQGDIDGFPPGEWVTLYSWKTDYLATAYVNRATTIAARVLTRDENEVLDRDFFKQRIEAADRLRRALDPGNRYYRMVYSEADWLPGLVIDRYDNYLVVQVTTAGMEKVKSTLFSILSELYPDSILVEKSIGASRLKEKLEPVNRLISPGKPPETIVEINQLKFKLNFLESQKTGFFLDQRENYPLLRHISRGKDVLDVFCYAGAWGIHAYRWGASSVQFLEISASFLEQARENMQLNHGNSSDFTFTRADAVQTLKKMSRERIRKDLIILDPPAFIKSRRHINEGRRGYKEINLRAITMLNPGGFLVTCSCSHFFTREDFLDTLRRAAADAQREVKLLAFKTQPYDHPMTLAHPPSEYLKCALLTAS